MELYRRNTFYLLLWREALVALFALVAAAAWFLESARALLSGSISEPLFSIGLIFWCG